VTEKGAQVVAISTDDVATLKRFKDENKLPYPLLSDAGGAVAKQYGGTVPVVGVASRATFVLQADGTVKEIVTGGDAIDPAGAIASCPLHRKG
jgi:peroxiredoxin Q/BCP